MQTQAMHSTTKRPSRLLQLVLGLATCSMLAAPALAAERVSAAAVGSIMIEGREFHGDQLTIEVASRGLAFIKLDGRAVARIFPQALERVPEGARASFAYRSDAQGRQHLVGVRWLSPDGHRTEERLFRVAAVVPDQVKPVVVLTKR